MTAAPKLHYTVATNPTPLPASPASGAPEFAQLTLTASNPVADPASNPVTITGVQLTLPLGGGKHDLTVDAADIQPLNITGWSLQGHTAPGEYAWVPDGGEIEIGAEKVYFVLDNVKVNTTPGSVNGLTVQEGSGGCLPPDCPEVDLSGALTKFPNGWGKVYFWVEPPIVAHGQPTTLNWKGPVIGSYALEWATRDGVVNVPGPGSRDPLLPVGVYPSAGDPPLTPDETTVYTLIVTATSGGEPYKSQQQKTVTVQAQKPHISMFRGDVVYDSNGRCTLVFHWNVKHAGEGCQLPAINAEDPLLPATTPRKGIPYVLDADGPWEFELLARNHVGEARSTLTLEWGETSQVVVPGPGTFGWPCLALTDDGSVLYASNGLELTALSIPRDPRASPQAGHSETLSAGAGTGITALTAAGPQWKDGTRTVFVAYGQASSPAAQLIGLSHGPSGFSWGSPASSWPSPHAITGKPALEAVMGVAEGASGSPSTLVYWVALWDGLQTAPGWPSAQIPDGYTPNNGVALAPDNTIYVGGGPAVLSWLLGLPQQGFTTMRTSPNLATVVADVAVTGTQVIVSGDQQVVAYDRQSWQKIRTLAGGWPSTVAGPRVALRADGLRLFATAGASGATISQYAPAVLTGGVPG